MNDPQLATSFGRIPAPPPSNPGGLDSASPSPRPTFGDTPLLVNTNNTREQKNSRWRSRRQNSNTSTLS